jgi:phosphate starvation-inducible PhoH-like protein
LKEAENVLADLEGIEFVYFSDKDVVRHKLVQMIVRAYEDHSSEVSANNRDGSGR